MLVRVLDEIVPPGLFLVWFLVDPFLVARTLQSIFRRQVDGEWGNRLAFNASMLRVVPSLSTWLLFCSLISSFPTY